jgi:hypothetical protein
VLLCTYVAASSAKVYILTGQFSFTTCLYGSMKSVMDRYTKEKEEQPAGLDATSQTKVNVGKDGACEAVMCWSD